MATRAATKPPVERRVEALPVYEATAVVEALVAEAEARVVPEAAAVLAWAELERTTGPAPEGRAVPEAEAAPEAEIAFETATVPDDLSADEAEAKADDAEAICEDAAAEARVAPTTVLAAAEADEAAEAVELPALVDADAETAELPAAIVETAELTAEIEMLMLGEPF